MRPVLLGWTATAAAAAVLAAADGAPRREAPRINVGGIVNAATNRPAPDNTISPGAIVSIYGTGLSTETREVRQSDITNGYLPENLAGVSVFFGPLPASLFFVSPLQINAQAPTALQPGEWEVKVRLERLEASEKVVVRPYSPGLFNVARHVDGMQVTRNAPARPGEYIVFFGTGFGPSRPPLQNGELAPLMPLWLASRIEAKIGDVALDPEDIYYWGLAPGYAGLYQFNLRVPAAAPSGDMEVMVKIADSWSQTGMRIPVER